MKTTHTPEPWLRWGGELGTGTDGEWSHHLNVCNDRDLTPQIQEDLDRAAACVNACEGINPDAVGDMLEALVEIRAVALSEESDEFAAIARNAINKARGTE